MPLSNKDLSDIAKEFAVAKGDISDDKGAIPNIQEQLVKKQEQYDRMYVVYRDAQVERVSPYETEHRWLDGTTYTPITDQQIQDAGARTDTNIFFPTSWAKSNAMLTTSGNGNPKTTSPNSESGSLNDSIEAGGIISQVNLLRNGQSSGASGASLNVAYSPGDTVLQFTMSHGFTTGKYLYVNGSGTSALVKITGTAAMTVNILEIIPPATVIGIGGVAVENIIGFTNGERQTLTSSSYQNILTQLTTRISTAAAFYNTALSNQLVQLNINIDASAQITAAKASITTAQTGYSTWNALSLTGVSGKFVDTSLNNFASSYNSRNAGISTRAGQITTALGAVSQDAQGNYSGNGLYLQRFKCMNFLINSANGPLYQVNGLRSAQTTFEQKVANGTDKLATFSNLVHYGGFTKDPSGNSVEVDGASQFATNDIVLLSGNDLPSIECTVSSVSGKIVVLSITIPPAYNKAAKGGIIKKV